ncbi:LysR family transcriptional regulator [Ornithinibacillus californiensis]|uniref:LysR family transcriptional regulator n=1 Tax=Ornithinibacillus californiensis TaxID=161536 RepID=UPI00064DBFC9|nr:LysR family transcriptional regulator [Ornithinibacillus californiensis]
MEIKHLQYFMEVTRTENFTSAAENLYITQPALSRIIKFLENELGTTLFIRTRKKLLLTEAGHVLKKHALKIEQQLQELGEELDKVVMLKKHVRIGLPTIVNSTFFSQLIASFHQEYPDVTFQLDEDGSKAIEDKVSHDLLDFGVVVLRENNEDIDYFKFVKEKLKLVVPSSHHLAGRQEVLLNELKEEPFIMFSREFELRNIVINACKEVGFQPIIISETSQLDFIEEMVASNLGIALLPESTCLELTGDIHTLTITNPEIEWNLAMIWKRDENISLVAKEFIRFAKLKLNDQNPLD